jgi:molecular chaperone GrpE
VTELLETVDDLDLALEHARSVPGAEALVRGVELARKRFLDALATSGVERFGEVGVPFDPNEAEALRVDPVPAAERDGTVTEVLRPGYRLGGRVLRAARVAVGRHVAV